MTDLKHDLLAEPWITTTDGAGRKEPLDLATVLVRLGTGEPLEFPSLQSQQRQAWHAFLVQLAALALHRGGETAVQQDPAAWRRLVGALAEDPAAFHLVAEDLCRPAFFQPPVPEGNLKAFKRSSPSPEILDVLITAKNFDVKADRFSAPASVEHWAFALITLQTFQGFLGRGNYGIARMNGGFASRPEVALAPGLGTGERFVRDLQVLLGERDRMIEIHGFREDGNALLWSVPWSGEKTDFLTVQELDPFYLEVCRRVRLAEMDDQLRAFVAPSEAARVEAKDHAGDLGDLWTPVSLKRKNEDSPYPALTVTERGFHYDLVQRILFQSGYRFPAALQVRDDDPEQALAVFRVLVRGQGKTGGLHQREIPIPGWICQVLGEVDTLNELALESEKRVAKAGDVRLKVLRPPLLVLGQEKLDRSGGQRLDYKDQRPAPWLARFDREVDRIFFENLFQDVEQKVSADELEVRWQSSLDRLVCAVFADALEALAPTGIHRYRAVARARSLFGFLRRQHLKRSVLIRRVASSGDEESEGPTTATVNPEPPSSEAHV